MFRIRLLINALCLIALHSCRLRLPYPYNTLVMRGKLCRRKTQTRQMDPIANEGAIPRRQKHSCFYALSLLN
uniref:Putative secreted peptide n=1 Tax=Anopheles braziliensis TaxID=58242 RepID=A0A2M3ZSE1_9DIPT